MREGEGAPLTVTWRRRRGVSVGGRGVSVAAKSSLAVGVSRAGEVKVGVREAPGDREALGVVEEEMEGLALPGSLRVARGD